MTEKRTCDICNSAQAKYDAKVICGPWAYMCEACFQKYAIKIKGTYTTLANIGKPGRKPYSD